MEEALSVLDLDFSKNNLSDEIQDIIDSFGEDLSEFGASYTKDSHRSCKDLFSYTRHYHHSIGTVNEKIFNIINLMNGAIEVLNLSVDENLDVIENVHYIVSVDESVCLIYIQLKQTKNLVPRFIGKRFSNIEALRRVAINLSGQYDIMTRVYL